MKKTGGYTLIELIIAMAIFSMMLLIVSLGFLQLMKMYQAGIASRNTQQNARFAMEQMVRAGRSAYKFASTGPANNQYVCFYIANSGQEYYISNGQLFAAELQLPSSPCDGTSVNNPHAITAPDVFVTKLNGTLFGQSAPASPADSLSVSLDLEVATGTSNGSFDSNAGKCVVGAGSQYCSLTALHSTVTLRGGQGAY